MQPVGIDSTCTARRFAHLHDRAFAELTLDGADRELESAFAFVRHSGWMSFPKIIGFLPGAN